MSLTAKQVFLAFIILASVLLAIGCSDGSDRPSIPPPPSLTALHVEPPLSVLDVGSSEHYRALATYSDGTTSEVSDQVSWSLEYDAGIVEGVREPENGGRYHAQAVMAGEDNIVATLNALSAKAAVTAVETKLIELVVSPRAVDLLEDQEFSFTAQGTYDDGHQQDLTDESEWASGDTAVASINDIGRVTAQSSGETTVSASLDGVSGSAFVDVHEDVELERIEVTPQNAVIYLDGSLQFNAHAYYSDGSIQWITNSALWYSSDTSVVAHDSRYKGRFNSITAGSAQVTAELGIRNKGTSNVTVEEVVLTRITTNPKDNTMEVGETRRYFTEAFASNGQVYSVNQSADQSYSVADSSVAYISNSPDNKGMLTALTQGVTTITSTFTYEGEEFTDLVTLTVCQGESC